MIRFERYFLLAWWCSSVAGCSTDAPAVKPIPPVDLPPRPQLRFHTQPPRDANDYPYSPDNLPAHGPIPRSTVFLSATGTTDPEGAATSVFWNVQDPFGQYLDVAPNPAATRAAFNPLFPGLYSIALEAVEIGGLRQIGQVAFTLVVAPLPCADDGTSPPCSDALAVPGGTFTAGSSDTASHQSERPPHLVTVAPFLLDRYEVTVGRFRRYLEDDSRRAPAEGAGAHPHAAGSGWRSEWDAFLPATRDDYLFALSECGGTWTNAVGHSEARPMSCVTWYEAFAFCISENKRLPTEAEWEYAAAGGSEQRTYPWGNAQPTADRAVFGCLFDGGPSCSDADLPVGGSVSAGSGRWGHLDLAGSVWEWTFDIYAAYRSTPCDNCVTVDGDKDSGRVFRGGDFRFDDPDSLRVATRYAFSAAYPEQTRGFRCASSLDMTNE